jgi:hypothetical protein
MKQASVWCCSVVLVAALSVCGGNSSCLDRVGLDGVGGPRSEPAS